MLKPLFVPGDDLVQVSQDPPVVLMIAIAYSVSQPVILDCIDILL